MATRKVRKVDQLYQDRELYSSPDMFSPPAERLPHVIRFELTTGCNWGRCSYCGGFDGIEYRVKTADEYREHVDQVWKRIGKRTRLAEDLGRIFIGGGNALAVGTTQLSSAIMYTGEQFMEFTGDSPGRIAIYGRTDSIRKKGENGLGRLFNEDGDFGLDLIYWGVESGSTAVLRYVQKGCTQDEILRAAETLNNTKVGASVMIMPGLGGIKYNDRHVRNTARVIGEIRPKFLTFMGVNPSPKSAYARQLATEEKEGKNRPLTNIELGEQMIQIINEMPTFDTKVGCFDCDVDQVGHNPLTFDAVDISHRSDKAELVEELKERLECIE
ncbi:MAG: radical SAM protein [Nanoarchaeota archaeon]|nr:radical SAM protein [Nanoarchaeota archaeon]